MTAKRKPYNTYTKEFKLEALRLLDQSDRPASEIAMKLGIRRNQLYKWKEQMIKKGDVPTAKRGRPKKEDLSETARLRQENNPRIKREASKGRRSPLISASQPNLLRKHGRSDVLRVVC